MYNATYSEVVLEELEIQEHGSRIGKSRVFGFYIQLKSKSSNASYFLVKHEIVNLMDPNI